MYAISYSKITFSSRLLNFYENVFGFKAQIFECGDETMVCLSHPESKSKARYLLDKTSNPATAEQLSALLSARMSMNSSKGFDNGGSLIRPKNEN